MIVSCRRKSTDEDERGKIAIISQLQGPLCTSECDLTSERPCTYPWTLQAGYTVLRVLGSGRVL